MEIALLFGLGLPLLLVVGAALWIRSLRMGALGDVLESLRGEPRVVCESANCFGVESAGATQVRGNGCLAASDDELVFRMWMPTKWVRVPRGAITEVSTPRSHLGKTKGVKLLKVSWQGEQGPDSVAFAVKDLQRWVRELEVQPVAEAEPIDQAEPGRRDQRTAQPPQREPER